MTTKLSQPSAVERAADRLGSALTIRISRGAGTGFTRLAAFDHALRCAGVADFNLVRLSSIIPPGCEVVEVEPIDQVRGGHGDLLYCVYADAYSTTPGESACAGMTWARHTDGSGTGLFAEYAGRSRPDVERELQHTLEGMIAAREPGFEPAGTTLSSVTCAGTPVCAVVIATFRSVSWYDGGPH